MLGPEPEIGLKNCYFCPGGGGGTRMARCGIRLVHGHTNSTLFTYFSGMKIDPNYAFLHAFFLICPSCPFQYMSIYDQKHTLFSNFARFCTPKRCTCVQCLVLKNNPNYVNFWTSLIPPLTFEWPPGILVKVKGLRYNILGLVNWYNHSSLIYISLTSTSPKRKWPM